MLFSIAAGPLSNPPTAHKCPDFFSSSSPPCSPSSQEQPSLMTVTCGVLPERVWWLHLAITQAGSGAEVTVSSTAGAWRELQLLSTCEMPWREDRMKTLPLDQSPSAVPARLKMDGAEAGGAGLSASGLTALPLGLCGLGSPPVPSQLGIFLYRFSFPLGPCPRLLCHRK